MNKYIKTFENYNKNVSIDSYLKTATFNELPINFKKGLLTYMVEGDPVEWTYEGDITDWVNGDNIKDIINDYAREKGDIEFEYGYVPTNLIIEKIRTVIEDVDLGYDSFEEWHEAYQSTNPANHGDSLFPIIVDDKWEEWIQDGWHRFNYYLSKGLGNIPVIKL